MATIHTNYAQHATNYCLGGVDKDHDIGGFHIPTLAVLSSEPVLYSLVPNTRGGPNKQGGWADFSFVT